MELTDEIRRLFATVTNMNVLPVEGLPNHHEAWVIRIDQNYGVAVEAGDDIHVSEKFAGARIWSLQMKIRDRSLNLLMLTSGNDALRMEFSVICSQFVEPGVDGEERERLVTSPLEWWRRWRSLLGNTMSERSAHGLLGELITYSKLMSAGESPQWTGASGGVIDLSTDISDYEVKSTISRYDTVVTIAGQFQLNRNTSRQLYLIFCRFEPSVSGLTINSVAKELIDLGVNNADIENELSSCGFEAGCAARSESFNLLEMRQYRVDDNFPGITLRSFVDGKVPDAVKQITYSLDLTGLPYLPWLD